jgi:hypothetical protein
MVDISGITGMIILAIVVLGALYIILSFIKSVESEEHEEEEGVVYSKTEPEPRGSEMSDEEFIESYTDPIMEDAMESLGQGIDSIRTGLDSYDRRLWEEASNDFHIAVNHIDAASGRMNEIPGMIEDESAKPVVDAKDRLDKCRRLRSMTIMMEESSDAMVEGNVEKAKADAVIRNELEKIVSGLKRPDENG